MAAAPGITLTALLQDLAGNPIGSAANPCKISIALCGFGPILPKIAGTSMLAKVGPIYLESVNGSFSTLLWGNDAITPSGTYYTIALLDGQGNVVQSNAYVLTGSGSFDLSNLVPNVPPYGFLLSALRYVQCSGSLIGGNQTFTAPGKIVAATYNGIIMNGTQCTISGNIVTVNFNPELGDRIDAFCVY